MKRTPDAPTIPGDPERVYASMGNYIFSTRTLLRELQDDAANENSSHDFGRDILPSLVGRSEVFAYNFQSNRIPGETRGAPTLTGATSGPSTPTTKPTWICARFRPRSISITASGRSAPPASPTRRRNSPSTMRIGSGQAIDSVISGGSILSGGMVRNSVIGRHVRVHAGALVEDSIILDNCDIGRRAKVRRAILDKNVRVPEDSPDRLRSRARPPLSPRHRKRHRGGGRQPLGGRSGIGYRLGACVAARLVGRSHETNTPVITTTTQPITLYQRNEIPVNQ